MFLFSETAPTENYTDCHTLSQHDALPISYPDGRIVIPSPGGREGAVKYTDYAIGRFIDEASTRAWFADTLFVIVADHDASVAGRVHQIGRASCRERVCQYV